MARLVVLIPDSLQSLVRKGEITSNYYNPGNLFEEAYIITPVKENVDLKEIQRTVGTARLEIINLPKKISLWPLSFPAFYLGKWLRDGIAAIQSLQPQLIRVHGHSYPALLGVLAAKKLSIPLVVSIHTQPDISWRKRLSWLKTPVQKLHAYYHLLIEKKILQSNAQIVAVYSPALSYAHKHGNTNAVVLHNCLNNKWQKVKTRYAITGTARLITVGRQDEWKNPINIILSLKDIPDATLLVIGDGAMHSSLITCAKNIGVEQRCQFILSVRNDDLEQILLSSDIFLHSSLYPEISKSTLEAMLVGLPVIHNIDQYAPVEELKQDHIYQVRNTSSEYSAAIKDLIDNSSKRESLGKKALAYASKNYKPAICEAKYVNLYRKLMSRNIENHE